MVHVEVDSSREEHEAVLRVDAAGGAGSGGVLGIELRAVGVDEGHVRGDGARIFCERVAPQPRVPPLQHRQRVVDELAP